MGFKMESDANLLLKIRSRTKLLKAWLSVRANGLQSLSLRTKAEVKAFEGNADRNLRRLYDKLLHGKFTFGKSLGVPIPRPGKLARPIVISSVEDRVVQRSTLNVLQQITAVSDYIKVPTSFGGIAERGVPEAIQSLVAKIKTDQLEYYARSDVENFFQGIPKDIVIEKLRSLIGDAPLFLDFVKAAMTVELRNLKDLGPYASLFPSPSIGVAQGGCLSPLLGNILLHDFDRMLNERGIVCFRYIDDFILLGKSRHSVMKAFKSARNLLAQYGLAAHEPHEGNDKANAGLIKDGFEFLGCKVIPGLITPNRKSRTRLLQNITDRFGRSKHYLQNYNYRSEHELSFLKTMTDVSNILRGWGSQYSFCNDKATLENLQKAVGSAVSDYLTFFRAHIRTTDEKKMFHAIGMHWLLESSSRFEPIKW